MGDGEDSTKTILLVEDDEDQALLAMRAMRRHGIAAEVDEVVVAGSGEKALDYLFGEGEYAGRDAEATPEFVLLDIHLPRMDGLRVLEKVRANERTGLVPVILFSSSREHIIEGYRLGANSYVAKPDSFAEFSEAMGAMGWYWLNFNESP